jgi:hypothetical protein
MGYFTRPPETYIREYDVLDIAKKDLAFYLMKRRNVTFDYALDYVNKVVGLNGAFALKDPKVMFLRRKENGDREICERGLFEYLDALNSDGYIIAPSLTCYVPPKIKKSILAEYIQLNMNLRKADKKQMFVCRMRAEDEAAAYFKTLQESRKVKNNSVSGTHASSSTPGYNKSSHSSLTSTCRCATSYANSNNEKILGGLRHYYAPAIVTFHILTAAQYSDTATIEECFNTMGIHRPTADDCMEAVRHSSQYYWTSEKHEREIYETLKSLTDAERAAWLYSGDLYHIDKHNGDFVKVFLKSLAEMKEGTHPDPESIIKGLDDNFTAIASLLCSPIISGMLLTDAQEKKPEAYHAVALTAQNMQEVCSRYQKFISAFLKADYLPHSIAQFPNSRRKSVPTSDTDSTIFTTQYWCDKYGGDIPFSHEAMSIEYVVTFLIAGLTTHTLMMYSANLGVDPSQLTQLEMKNEYIFPVYTLTSLAKHYFTLITAGEGNVYATNKRILEVKGVNLRSSNVPPFINEQAHNYMRWIIDSIMNNKPITVDQALRPILELEKRIIDDIYNGGFEFMNGVQIKGSESYSQGEDAVAYQSYTFWNEVFGAKYGQAPEPPYRAIKVSVSLPNKTAVKAWLDSIDDITIRRNLERWVEDNRKNDVKLFRLPREALATHGIPKEIRGVVDIRGIVSEVLKTFYIVLESLGFYMKNDKKTRILSDEYSLPEDGMIYGIPLVEEEYTVLYMGDGDDD